MCSGFLGGLFVVVNVAYHRQLCCSCLGCMLCGRCALGFGVGCLLLLMLLITDNCAVAVLVAA